MKFLVKKNVIFRKLFNSMEKKKRVYRFLLSNNKIFLHIRWQCFLNVVKINTMSSITQSKNFCYLTGKTKIFTKKYRISRFMLRKLIMCGNFYDFY